MSVAMEIDPLLVLSGSPWSDELVTILIDPQMIFIYNLHPSIPADLKKQGTLWASRQSIKGLTNRFKLSFTHMGNLE